MTLLEKSLCIVLTIILVIVIAFVLIGSSDPVSLNCKRACAHIDGAGYVDCVLMCEGNNGR